MPARLSQKDLDDFEALIGGDGDHFSALLVRLIRKADPDNRQLLRLAFPDHVRAVELYDLSVPRMRLWRCERCDTLNLVALREDPWPTTCLQCLEDTEPPRIANQREWATRGRRDGESA